MLIAEERRNVVEENELIKLHQKTYCQQNWLVQNYRNTSSLSLENIQEH
jgi:hypothetical protein